MMSLYEPRHKNNTKIGIITTTSKETLNSVPPLLGSLNPRLTTLIFHPKLLCV